MCLGVFKLGTMQLVVLLMRPASSLGMHPFRDPYVYLFATSGPSLVPLGSGCGVMAVCKARRLSKAESRPRRPSFLEIRG